MRALRQRHLVERLLRSVRHGKSGWALGGSGRRRLGLGGNRSLGDGRCLLRRGRNRGDGAKADPLDRRADVRGDVLRLALLGIAAARECHGDRRRAGVSQLRARGGRLARDLVGRVAVHFADDAPRKAGVLEGSLGEDEGLAGHVRNDHGRGGDGRGSALRHRGHVLRRTDRERRAREQQDCTYNRKARQAGGYPQSHARSIGRNRLELKSHRG